MLALPELIPELEDVDIQVSGLRDDSRKVQQGDLFIAVSGETYSTQKMLQDIQQSGAAAALYDASETLDKSALGNVPLFSIENLRQKRGHIASRFYNHPSADLYVVGVTGTNGKTSCTQYLAAALPETCGVIGTMGWGVSPKLVEPGLTTPGALRIQSLFAELRQEKAEAVCLEASSHGLVQDRLAGVEIDVAVFTNLTRDHLDYHGSLEAYKAAKKRLFLSFPIRVAVLNFDDPFCEEIVAELKPDTQVLRFSLHDENAEVYCSVLQFTSAGITGLVETPWGQVVLNSPLIGDFNASNLLAVVSVLGSHGCSAEDIGARIANLKNVKGRMDRIELSNGAVAVIDYAHTPDALENALKALRGHCQGQLICVMGCGGNRDAGKRPLMGEIASRLADRTVVTDDNPRTEASPAIIEQILAGIPDQSNVVAISDRRAAIRAAVTEAKSGDIVLVSGKGHEDYQEVNGVKWPFSDYHEIGFLGARWLNSRQVIVGLGVTGQAMVRYCQRKGLNFIVVEDNPASDTLKELQETGDFDLVSMSDWEPEYSDRVFLSPGIPQVHPVIQNALEVGAHITNDIQLFADQTTLPLGLITGSNGKSTVTSFVGQLLQSAGSQVALGGNFGIPAADILESETDICILEVSSYQLELATFCHARVAVLLNLSPDHLDRYDSLAAYYRAKTHVFNGAETAVYARDIDFDLGIAENTKIITFGVDEPEAGHYGLRQDAGQWHIARGSELLVAVSELPHQGQSDLLNMMAALATADAFGINPNRLLGGLKQLSRLPHRSEVLEDIKQHKVINDSKSTNPASTLAALHNLQGETRDIVLILGGLGKQADFTSLQEALGKTVKRCLVFGADRESIARQLGGTPETFPTLEACLSALSLNESSVILFSPGCGSQDQYKDYLHRGEAFKALAREYFR